MNFSYETDKPLSIITPFRGGGSIRAVLLTFAAVGFTFLAFAQRPAIGQTPVPGDSKESIKVGSVERTFIRYIPKGYDGSTAVPLLVVLHGRGGDAKGMENMTGFSQKADAEKFIVLYPNAVGTPSAWNIGMNPAITADDDGFIKAMVERVEQHLKIDHKRVFVCGFSSGGMMAYRLGGTFPNLFASIGVASGSVGDHLADGTTYTNPAPSRPVPAIVFHGKMDTHVKYDGGSLHVDTLSVADSIKFWTNADGCTGAPTETTKQNGNLVIDDYTNCRGGSEVILRSFGRGTHEWPSLRNNDNFDATEAVWNFFVQHPMP
jgi:polyhydroxybutyrate depolymerase